MLARGGAGLAANIAEKPVEWYCKKLIENHVQDNPKPEEKLPDAAAMPPSPQP
jgi:hypothetical protein